jgi:hypothetical protein
MRQAPIDWIGSTSSKRFPTSGGSNMGETLRPADLWQRHLGEGPPRRGRMTWDECQSKLLALTAEVARSAPATSPEKAEDFLRTEREIGLVEELAAFICEHFRELDEWGEAVGRPPAEARDRAADPPVARLADGRRALSLLSRGSRRLLDPLRRLADSALRTMAPSRRGGSRGLASTLGGGRLRPAGAPGAGERRRAARASCQRPVEVRSRSGPLGNGQTVDLSVSGMRVRFAQPIDLRWHTVMLLDPGDSLGPIVTRFALVREIVPSREYAIRFLDLYPRDVYRLSRLPAA